MPNEPERDIEKLLKACAQKRRDEAGAPLELHPATRRMLQAEVARRTAKAPRAGNMFVRMLAELRPRLAFGVALLAVLLVATWALLPSLDKTKSEVQMAQSDAVSPAKLARRAGPEVASAPLETSAVGPVAETRALALNSARQASQPMAMKTLGGLETAGAARDEAKASFAASKPAPPARPYDAVAFKSESYGPAGSPATPASEPVSIANARANAPARQAAFQETRERGLFEGGSPRSIEMALAPPAAAAPPADLKEQFVSSDRSRTPSVPVTQKFARADSRSRTVLAAKEVKSIAPEEILTLFQVSQAGDQFQVIDSDGSTYAGFLRPAPQPAAAPAEEPHSVLANRVLSVKEAGGAMVADKPAAPQNPTYSFQVVGTNSMSRQRIVFTGNLTVDTNALSAMQAKFPGFRGGASQLQQDAPTPSELQNSRITGRAVLGDGRTIEINAAPVSP